MCAWGGRGAQCPPAQRSPRRHQVDMLESAGAPSRRAYPTAAATVSARPRRHSVARRRDGRRLQTSRKTIVPHLGTPRFPGRFGSASICGTLLNESSASLCVTFLDESSASLCASFLRESSASLSFCECLFQRLVFSYPRPGERQPQNGKEMNVEKSQGDHFKAPRSLRKVPSKIKTFFEAERSLMQGRL